MDAAGGVDVLDRQVDARELRGAEEGEVAGLREQRADAQHTVARGGGVGPGIAILQRHREHGLIVDKALDRARDRNAAGTVRLDEPQRARDPQGHTEDQQDGLEQCRDDHGHDHEQLGLLETAE